MSFVKNAKNTIPHTSDDTRCLLNLLNFLLPHNLLNTSLAAPKANQIFHAAKKKKKTFFVVLLKRSFVIHLCCLKNIVLVKLTISWNAIMESVTLKWALFIPSYPQDIFSVKFATANGAAITFKKNKNELIHKNGTKFNIFVHNRLYVDMKVGLTTALDKRGFVCVWRAGQWFDKKKRKEKYSPLFQ